jgi:hypothetical protein
LGKLVNLLHVHVLHLEVEELVHRVKRAVDLHAVLQLQSHLLAHQRLEKGEKVLESVERGRSRNKAYHY